jgi:hypothetical protein
MRNLAEVRAKYPPGLITAAELARLIGVTNASVHQAIQLGRVPVYDASGKPVPPAILRASTCACVAALKKANRQLQR